MDDDKDANKSEISLVFEIALKRNMPVSFEVCVPVLLFGYLNKLNGILGSCSSAHAPCIEIHCREMICTSVKWKLL
jgi:hypothetical protein